MDTTKFSINRSIVKSIALKMVTSECHQSLKLCFIAAGNTPHSSRWINFFYNHGHEVHWVSLSPFTEMIGDGIKTYEFDPKGFKINKFFRLPYAISKIRGLVKRINPDLMHIHSVGTYGLLGSVAGFHPVFVTAWGSDVLFAGRSFLKGLFVKHTLYNSELITCDAEHMKQAMIDMGVCEEKIMTIYFGTDTEKFFPREKSNALRRSLGINGKPMVISIRNLEALYDVETLLRAAPLVLEHVPDAIFVVGGDGRQRHFLEGLAGSLGIGKSVVFTGPIPNDKLPEYFSSADVYVSTSLSDAGLAASTAEAMACGIPVVVTDSGENNLWVEEGKGGFLVPVKHPYAMAERITYLLQNSFEANRFGLYNRTVIEKRDNYYVEMAKMENIYRKIAEEHGKG